MKHMILTTALFASLAVVPLAATPTAFAADNSGTQSYRQNLQGAQRHNPTAGVFFQSRGEARPFTVLPTGYEEQPHRFIHCDITKNGAAFRDACAPDGMAAGG